MPRWDWQEILIYLFTTSPNIPRAGEDSARGRCLTCPTRRCGGGRKEAKRWVQSKTARCKILFVASSLQNALSTDKGIMNSHVNLSPIKLSAKGSVGWNSRAMAPWSHAKVATTCRLSWHIKKGCFSPLSAYRLAFTSVCSVLCSVLFCSALSWDHVPKPFKTWYIPSNGCTIGCLVVIFCSSYLCSKDIYPMLVLFCSIIYHQSCFCLLSFFMGWGVFKTRWRTLTS